MQEEATTTLSVTTSTGRSPTSASASTTSNVDENSPVSYVSASNGVDYHHALSGQDLPDTKEGIEELCPVCGDKVSGYHYGLLTCESCKGFFKRTVQNKKVYTCVAERNCHIDKTQRKRCPFCRFQKCLEVGMKLEAVRADRMRGGRNKFGPMYKRDRARKLQLIRQRQLVTPSRQMPTVTVGNEALTINTYNGATFATPSSTNGGIHIKQEIQIPTVSSLTSSPDSSPSPIINPSIVTMAASTSTTTNNNILTNGTAIIPTDPNKMWPGSTKTFQYDMSSNALIIASQSSEPTPKVPPLIRDITQSIDDKEWQSALFGLLQNQSYNQCEVDLFELMCKVLDQNLFAQVDWARNSPFFKDLKVDDQMKLLQHSWSDMLVLDHLHQRIHNDLPDETPLANGQKFDLLQLALLGVTSTADQFHDISRKLQELKFDIAEYICMKFLLLLNPSVRGLLNKKHVEEAFELVQQTLMDYNMAVTTDCQDKFGKLMALLHPIHAVATRGEEYLYQQHVVGGAPTQTLLMEMLHAKRK